MIEPAEPSLNATISRAAAGCAAKPAATRMATERMPANGREPRFMIKPPILPTGALPAPTADPFARARAHAPEQTFTLRRLRIKRLTFPDLQRDARPILSRVWLLGHGG